MIYYIRELFSLDKKDFWVKICYFMYIIWLMSLSLYRLKYFCCKLYIFSISRDIVGHYKGKVYSWDVVNEPFDDSGNFRRSIWYNNLGESYIAEAFKLAHAADPSAKLYINDYNIEAITAKSTAMYNLVKKLKSEGVPIHGIGIQGHLIVGNVPSAAKIQANLERFVY